jgi:hypothetical protein
VTTEDGKNAAAVALGRMGGKARAAGMSAKKRKEIAQNAAAKRWQRDSRFFSNLTSVEYRPFPIASALHCDTRGHDSLPNGEVNELRRKGTSQSTVIRISACGAQADVPIAITTGHLGPAG